MLAVYIHIPFCKSICSYCDFCKILYHKKYINNYLETLEKEIKYRYKNELISSIYIGGGTPSCLNLEELNKLFQITNIFKKNNNIEFTIECNPEDISDEKVNIFKKYGVSRISLGVQTFDKKCIDYLGRQHNFEIVQSAINIIKKHQITNINIDLIYGINEDVRIVKEDLKKFIKLDIPHLSCYSLIIEPKTILSINKHKYIDEEVELKMYNIITRIMKKWGYKHYEISNYAKEGYESKHNLTYWNNNEYYGFGLSAVSYIKNTRMINTKNMTKYLQGKYLYDIIKENLSERINNEIMLSLRTSNGLNLNEFYNKYSMNFFDNYDIKFLLQKGYLLHKGESIIINEKYIYISNEIIIKVQESRRENERIN